MTLQTMVDRWILNQSSPLPTVPPLAPNPVPALEAMTTGAAGRFANAMQFCLTYMLSPFESAALFAEWQNGTVTSAERLVNLFNGFIAWGAPEAYAPQQVDVVRFPITAYQSNDFYDIAQNVLAFFLTITLLFPVSRLIRGLVAEKETKIREGMKMMVRVEEDNDDAGGGGARSGSGVIGGGRQRDAPAHAARALLTRFATLPPLSRVQGLSDAALLGSWVATYALMFLIISVLITIVSSTTIFRSSNKGLIFITFWLYGWSCIFFSYFISVFFSRAKTASTLGVVLFLGGFFPYFGLAAPDYSFETKTAAAILSPTAFGFALDIIASYENSGVGATPANLLVIERNFSLSRALGMLFADCLLYWFLGWYIDATLPAKFREFGVPRPWYFPVTGAYWREVFNIEPKPAHTGTSADTSALLPAGTAGAGAPGAASEPATPLAVPGAPAPAPGTHTEGGRHGVTAMLRTAAAHLHASRKHNGPPTDPSFIEPLDASMRAKEREGKAVLLAGLRKEFSTPDGTKVAVDDISLSMHEGQITCLLGHNGAG
jgi:ABC-type multidrug transport system fused ATPase/permease subunit